MVFRVLSFLMMLFFIVSVAVQFNDPDWLLWMVVYGAILVATMLITFNSGLQVGWLLIALILIYGVGVFQLSPGFKETSFDALMSTGMDSAIDERVRELWGLVICFFWTIILMINHFLSVKKTSNGT